MNQDARNATDSELLAAYARGDGGAFEQLVARHGGMVHGVCLRALGSREAAEDAAQAAFVVLAAKARSVKGSVSAFLHGAAMNVARRQLASEAARRAREKEAAEMLAREKSGKSSGWDDVRPHLDAALEELPAAERAAVLLHYMEGKPRAEVARDLGEPEGTVAWRLKRALERMRGFLERHGVGLSGAALPAMLATQAGGAACPAFLLAAAGKLALAGSSAAGIAAIGVNVSALAKGALKMMFWAKVKMTAAVVIAAATVSTAVPVTYNAVKAAEEAKKPEPVAKAPAPEPAIEMTASFGPRVDALALGISCDAGTYNYGDRTLLKLTLVNYRNEQRTLVRACGGLDRADTLTFNFLFSEQDSVSARNSYHDRGNVHVHEPLTIGPNGALAGEKDINDLMASNGLLFEAFRRNRRFSITAEIPELKLRSNTISFNGEKEDKELTGFLEAVKFAGSAAIGTVDSSVVAQDASEWEPPSWTETMSPASDKLLYGAKWQPDRPLALRLHAEPYRGREQPIPRFNKGERIIFCWGAKPADSPAAIKWSPEREKAVRFALAPGWSYERSQCPWHPHGEATRDIKACKICGGQRACSSHPICRECAVLDGICSVDGCSRKVGPATRGVELLLGTEDPMGNVRKNLGLGLTLTVALGEAPKLWVAAKLADGVKETPEIHTPGGRDARFLDQAVGPFFLVEGPGTQGPRPVFCITKSSPVNMPNLPLSQSLSAKLILKSDDFAKPGAYTVRAAAGRLVSNPVMVVVSDQAAEDKRVVGLTLSAPETAVPGRPTRVALAIKNVSTNAVNLPWPRFIDQFVTSEITTQDGVVKTVKHEGLSLGHGKYPGGDLKPGEVSTVELSLTIPQEGVAHIRCVLETSRKSCPWWSFWEGRVESNTVRIEAKAAEAVPAGPKALPPMPAPEPAPGPAAGGPQPRWQPGGNSVEAVDAASGKLIWKANVGFPIGNVVAGPAQWTITSQDGRQAVTIDAATGKMLLRDDLVPPKPADPQETF